MAFSIRSDCLFKPRTSPFFTRVLSYASQGGWNWGFQVCQVFFERSAVTNFFTFRYFCQSARKPFSPELQCFTNFSFNTAALQLQLYYIGWKICECWIFNCTGLPADWQTKIGSLAKKMYPALVLLVFRAYCPASLMMCGSGIIKMIIKNNFAHHRQ